MEEHNTSKHNNPVRLLIFVSNLLVGDQSQKLILCMSENVEALGRRLGLPLPEKIGMVLFQQRGDLLT